MALPGANVLWSLGLRLHRGQSRGMLQRQVTYRRKVQLARAQWPQAWGMSGSRQGGVIRSGGKRIVGECGRRRGSRVRRVGPRPLDTVRLRVIFLVGMRPAHALGNGICRKRRKTTAAAMPRAEQGVVVMVMMVMVAARSSSRSITLETKMLVALDLRGGRSQQIYVHPRRTPVTVVTCERSQIRTQVASIVGEGLRRGNVG